MVYDAEDVKEEAPNQGGPDCPSSQSYYITITIASNQKCRNNFK